MRVGCDRSTTTRFSSSISTLMLVQGLHMEILLMMPSTGSGCGATNTSHCFRIPGNRSMSQYCGFTSTFPGASGMKVESICIGSRHKLTIS